MTVGAELRAARERAGLSAEQVSERTKIQLYKVEALENGDFERLPQGIYLDGIVRAYAHELAIPHEPLVERVRRERGTRPGDWPVPFNTSIDLRGPAEPRADHFHVLDVPDPDNALDSFATEHDLRAPGPPDRAAPPHRERAGLALPVVVLLTAAGVGTYLYRTTPFLERERTVAPTTAALQTDPAVTYSENALPPEVQPSGRSSSLTGSWRFATQVESSSYSRFAGLQLGYDLTLEQDGNRIKGVGRKVSENGATLGRRAQTPLMVTGTIAGDRLMLNFVERGTRRQTRGTFELLVDDNGTLRGSFSSTAARSSGRVEAHRVITQ